MFFEHRLFENVSRGVTGGPGFRTIVDEAPSGHEARLEEWEVEIGEWDIAYKIRTPADMALIRRLFRVSRGRAIGFRYKDWTDFTSNNSDDISAHEPVDQPIGIGDGANKTFQLVKVYTYESESVTRTIKKPVAGTVRVARDTVEDMAGWSVDTVTGIVTYVTAPAAAVVVTAGFEFDVPVRFDTDKARERYDGVNTRSWESLPLKELREP